MTDVLLFALGGAIIALDVVLVWHLLNGAPFLPSKRKSVERMVAACRIGSGMKAVDIGSGDGRVVIALARAGAEAHGYENNPLLVRLSRRNIRRAGLEDRAFIHGTNFWKTTFESYDAVTLFGITHIMGRLEKKLQNELKPGARVASLGFTFPHWPKRESIGEVHVYEQP